MSKKLLDSKHFKTIQDIIITCKMTGLSTEKAITAIKERTGESYSAPTINKYFKSIGGGTIQKVLGAMIDEIAINEENEVPGGGTNEGGNLQPTYDNESKKLLENGNGVKAYEQLYMNAFCLASGNLLAAIDGNENLKIDRLKYLELAAKIYEDEKEKY